MVHGEGFVWWHDMWYPQNAAAYLENAALLWMMKMFWVEQPCPMPKTCLTAGGRGTRFIYQNTSNIGNSGRYSNHACSGLYTDRRIHWRVADSKSTWHAIIQEWTYTWAWYKRIELTYIWDKCAARIVYIVPLRHTGSLSAIGADYLLHSCRPTITNKQKKTYVGFCTEQSQV